ncbi:MAG TPA: hypothetical protein PK299_10765 [Anaerolineales bacterium]|nr:hypothetical protein [Anaerolineales bacterium]
MSLTRSAISAVPGVLFGVALNVASNMISVYPNPIIWIIILTTLSFISFFIIHNWNRKKIFIKPGSPNAKLVINPNTPPDFAKNGLIILLSEYKTANQNFTAEKLAKLDERIPDSEWMTFGKSNMLVPITAIQVHQSTLKVVWLIHTSSSAQTALALERYVREVLTIHEKQLIILKIGLQANSSDLLLADETRKRIADIFDNRIKKFSLTEESVVVDITGGTKGMALGATLACLDENRLIQVTQSTVKQSDLVTVQFPFKVYITDAS